MTTLADIFQFFIVQPGGGRFEVFPLYSDLIFSDQQDGEVRSNREVSTELVFVRSDYEYFKNLRSTLGRCAVVGIDIEQGGLVRYSGQLSMNTGEWSSRDAQVTLPIQRSDNRKCVESVMKEKLNIFELSALDELRILIGSLSETVTCTAVYQNWNPAAPPPVSCLPDMNGWTMVERRVIITIEGSTESVIDTAIYQREEYSGPTPPGGGWIDLGGDNYARALFVFNETYTFEENVTPESTIQNITFGFDVIGANQDQLADNGVLLSEILPRLVNECGLTVRSNFFGINPDGTAPDNRAYQYALEHYQSVVVFQKTDIKNPDALQNASRGEITLDDLIGLFETMQVYWDVRNGAFILEHITFFEANGFDASAEPMIEGKDDFTARQDEVPARYVFSWMDKLRDEDFDGKDIVLPFECTNGEATPVTANVFSTNMADMQVNPESYANEGFVVVSTFLFQGNYHIFMGEGLVTGENRLNNPFSWAAIHDNLWRDNMPLPEGTINDTPVVFDSVAPTIDQQDLEIPMTYDQFFALDASKRLQSQMGWGKISSGEYSCRNQTYTVKLKQND